MVVAEIFENFDQNFEMCRIKQAPFKMADPAGTRTVQEAKKRQKKPNPHPGT